ncbi:dephospho-CoA kinase, partial [bacterium]
MDDLRPIGLTGAIAGGKTTVLRMLADLGLRTASSDLIAREIFHEDSMQDALARRLGEPKPVLPATLRTAMLRDPGLRRWTNQAMHPLVGERLAKIEVDVVEVPLLFEACLQGRYREVWTASCGPAERKRRLHERYGLYADLNALGSWQLSERVKNALADRVVRTDHPSEHVLRFLMVE